MARSPKSVRRLMKDKPTLKFLELEISAQKALLENVRRLLPGDLADHCVAARKRDQQLILHADSPVWATRLRYNSPQLISLLQPSHPSLREIKIKLVLARSDHPPQRFQAHVIPISQLQLSTTALQIPSNHSCARHWNASALR